MTLTTFLIVALAVFRLTILISQDDGPFDLCWRLRDYVKNEWPAQPVTIIDGYNYWGFRPSLRVRASTSSAYGEMDSWQFRGLTCPYCVSFWIGIVVALAWYILPVLTVLVCVPLALSGVTVVIEKWSNKG